jgi:hypothetical protein
MGPTMILLQGSTGALMRVLHPKCRVCGKHRPVEEFVAGGPVTGYCLRCLEKNQEALDLFAENKLPHGCHVCNRSMRELSAAEPSADVRLYAHPKDGIWQLLCINCSDQYEQKRADLYRGTPYGHTKKI